MVERPVELVDGVRAECVSNLGPVEGYPDGRPVNDVGYVNVGYVNVGRPGRGVRARSDVPVVGDVSEGEALDLPPAGPMPASLRAVLRPTRHPGQPLDPRGSCSTARISSPGMGRVVRELTISAALPKLIRATAAS